jgi:hypothetical protein
MTLLLRFSMLSIGLISTSKRSPFPNLADCLYRVVSRTKGKSWNGSIASL